MFEYQYTVYEKQGSGSIVSFSGHYGSLLACEIGAANAANGHGSGHVIHIDRISDSGNTIIPAYKFEV